MSSKMEGAIIMITLNLVAAILAFFGGIIIDNFYKMMQDGGFFDAIPIAWDSSGSLLSIINLYYLTCILIAGTGWLVFALSIYRREGVDAQATYYG